MNQPLHTQTVGPTAVSVTTLTAALGRALAGGPPVLPLPTGPTAAVLLGAAHADQPFDDVALLVPTSGSTGSPKLVELTATALRASAAGTAVALGGAGQWLLALPTTHIAGLQVVCRSVLGGTTPVVLEGDGFRAAAFATAVASLTGARRYTSLVPTQLLRVLADPAATAALAGFDAVLVGGAATSPVLLARARAAGIAICITYGMSETAGGCVYDGVPLPGVDVDLDPNGRITIGGPTVARGYRGEPALTAKAFGDGRFRTADVGRLVDGRLDVLGRLDDVIITGGVNVHPLVVEAVLARQPGVENVVVGGVPDVEWGQVVTAWVVGPAAPDTLRAAVRAELGAAAVPRHVHRLDTIPTLPSGKPDRRALMQAAAEA